MRLWSVRSVALAVLAAPACLLAVSCTPERKHALLSFFFDGVPPLEPPGATRPAQSAPRTRPAVATARPRVKRVVWYEHKPTREKKTCRTCHDPAESFALIRPPRELCARCHKDLRTAYPRMHGPVAVGSCVACHEPHRSTNKHLVRSGGPKLCLSCHEPAPGGGSAFGCVRKSDEASCLECHNAHGGTRAYYLADRPAGAEAPVRRPLAEVREP